VKQFRQRSKGEAAVSFAKREVAYRGPQPPSRLTSNAGIRIDGAAGALGDRLPEEPGSIGGGAVGRTATNYRAALNYAETGYGRIAYIERGTGEAALFLHGFPLNSFQWWDAITRLSMHRRCIAPDFMAMGYTEVAHGQGVDPEAQVAMLAELLDALSIFRVDVIANDSGGQVAQLFLAQTRNASGLCS
jgi:hypothetical protein